ncbi:hypothetical protein ILUMI_22421 [Ignelater luminosus]|uniref:Mutator-like transposase domain-containing protein n=1 Tax=Ignelater luminosus TaxID=2038154 RepID=A0A8K0CEF6_IGNLU|nr:hypothetical protein ILUMI_22421 [Ignelater luminosus]
MKVIREMRGIISISGEYYNLEEFLSGIEVPSMSSKISRKHHENVCNGWENAAQHAMEKDAEKEAFYAIQHGEVDADGVSL